MTKKVERAKRRELIVRNHPGIYKVQVWNEKTSKWLDTGKYRAIRRVVANGVKKKESGFFEHLDSAKLYRSGETSKSEDLGHHKDAPAITDNRLRFGKLLSDWKDFHFMAVDFSTRQFYEKRLRYFEFLDALPVEEINPGVVDKMIRHWKSNETTKSRMSFSKELDALKVILNFYRKRHDPRFPIPVYREHYAAAEVVRKSKDGIKAMTADDLKGFFSGLRQQKNPMFFPLALSQFCLSLRIGEACGLHWADFDFKTRTVKIQNTIVWDYETWEARIKDRPKNGKSRVLAVPEILIQELLKWKALSGDGEKLVFHKNGIPLNRQTVAKAYQRSLELSGIEGLSGTHLIRRSSATHANRVTGDFWAVSLNLGHSSPEETTRYVSEVSEQKLKVANALNGFFSVDGGMLGVKVKGT